jgi:hypothetical protein
MLSDACPSALIMPSRRGLDLAARFLGDHLGARFALLTGTVAVVAYPRRFTYRAVRLRRLPR